MLGLVYDVIISLSSHYCSGLQKTHSRLLFQAQHIHVMAYWFMLVFVMALLEFLMQKV